VERRRSATFTSEYLEAIDCLRAPHARPPNDVCCSSQGRIVMTKALLAVLSFAAVFGADLAMAADFGPLPANAETAAAPWSGCYVGPELGGLISAGNGGAGTGLGAVFGGVAGCDYHSGHVVFGAEGEFLWSTMTAHKDSITGPPFPTSSLASTQNQWDADIAARVGYLFRYDTLSYLKIGAAAGDYKFTTTSTAFPLPATVTSGSLTMAGLLLGGGLELMLAPNWFARGEFDLVLFNPKDATMSCTPVAFCASGSSTSTQSEVQFFAKVGATYRFR
jgi:opacity protein-like surface antigen